MKELQTYLGTDIPLETRAILYLCDLTENNLEVVKEIMFDNQYEGLEAYANIRNPESQLMYGNTYNELIRSVHQLHGAIPTKRFIDMLKESI